MRGSLQKISAALVAAFTVCASVAIQIEGASGSPGQSVTDLRTLTAEDLAQSLVGSGVTIANVEFKGNKRSAGQFSGLTASQIESGVVLSSGSVTDSGDFASSVLGPNDSDGTSGEFGGPGDADLDELVDPDSTNDASVLEFDFVPTTSQLAFEYVFGSEEYNEFIGQFNDVFGFFVNGNNCATIGSPPEPVTVNDINGDSNSELYRDNDPSDDGQPSIDIELDGLTTVLECVADVDPGVTNHMKLAIADTADSALDSDVFIRAGSIRANNPPVAEDDSYSVDPDTSLVVDAPGVLTNDTDPDGDTLAVDDSTATVPAHGTVSLSEDGSFTYTPDSGYSGPDSFTYQATDGAADSTPATVDLDIAPANQPPVVNDDSYDTDEDTTLSVDAPGVLANDTDADGDTLTASVLAAPAHGTVTLNADGSFTYEPVANFNGTDIFTYRATDGINTPRSATVTVDVAPVDDPIVAHDDSYTTPEDTALDVAAPGVLGNDENVDGDPASAVVVTPPTHGTVELSTDGGFGYTPAQGFLGSDSFTYTAGDSDPATVTITVAPVNHAPTSANDAYSTAEDTSLEVAAPGVLDNDSDPDGDTLVVTTSSEPEHGTLTMHGDGSFEYLPDSNFNGSDAFTYRVTDGSLESAPATVALTVTSVNDSPVAGADSFVTSADTSLEVLAPGVLANDTDADGDALTSILTTGVEHGTLALDADGSFSYVPASGFVGTDVFSYRAGDGTGGGEKRSPGRAAESAEATVTIRVTAQNNAPVVADDAYRTVRDVALTVAAPGVLNNDDDPDGNTLNVRRVSGPHHGTLRLSVDGGFAYTPNQGFLGRDTFQYRASDGTAESGVADVTITVRAPKAHPVQPPQPPGGLADTGAKVTQLGVLGGLLLALGIALTALGGAGRRGRHRPTSG